MWNESASCEANDVYIHTLYLYAYIHIYIHPTNIYSIHTCMHAWVCLHTGPGNTGKNYEMGGTILSKTVKEKDLGVSMNANMKVSEQCRIAASKGNQVLGMIRRNITYKEKNLIVPLYKAIVRPHLEYCIQAWSPYLRKDIDMLEKIQRRATKLIPGLRDLRYEERLKECGLTTLETRRLRGSPTK